MTNRVVYGRITALTLEDFPISSAEGVITQGSANVAGDSAVRRTCSLSLVIPQDAIEIDLWEMHTRFLLEVGIKEDPSLEIQWYKQGIFIITGISKTLNTTNYTISIQGQDKMCLINGTVNGALPANIDFGKIDIVDEKGNVTKQDIPLKDIIIEGVHKYGDQPLHKIIVKDLDEPASRLLEYRYTKPLYLLKRKGSSVYSQATINGNQPIWVSGVEKKLSEITYIDLVQNNENEATEFSLEENGEMSYICAKILNGQTVGYQKTPLVYPDTLEGSPGQPFSEILKKIKDLLGNYEYFYDIDGNFIFQREENYVNHFWSPLEEETMTIDLNDSPIIYDFSGNKLLNSLSVNPASSNIKNDFSVWGAKEGGAAIHLRYAIDNKPTYYNSIKVLDSELIEYNKKNNFYAVGQESIEYTSDKCDWREIIYQMARDFTQYGHLDDFEYRVKKANPYHYPTGKTGYEQYYIDVEGFWRDMYDPNLEVYTELDKTKEITSNIYTKDVQYVIYEITPEADAGVELYKQVEPGVFRRTYQNEEEGLVYYTKVISYTKLITEEEDNFVKDTDFKENLYLKQIDRNFEVKHSNEKTVLDITCDSVTTPLKVKEECRHNAFMDYDLKGLRFYECASPIAIFDHAGYEDMLEYEWYHQSVVDGKLSSWRKYPDIHSNWMELDFENEGSTENQQFSHAFLCKAINRKLGLTAVTQPFIMVKPKYQVIYFSSFPKNEVFYYGEDNIFTLKVAQKVGENQAFKDSAYTYQWYYKEYGQKSFTALPALEGAFGSELQFPLQFSKQNISVYCEIIGTKSKYKLTSKTYILRTKFSEENINEIQEVTPPIKQWRLSEIKLTVKDSERENGKLLDGDSITLEVSPTATEGLEFTYEWYGKEKNSNTWKKLSSNTSSSNFTFGQVLRETHDYMQIRCMVSDNAGTARASKRFIIKFRPDLQIIKHQDTNQDLVTIPSHKEEEIKTTQYYAVPSQKYYTTTLAPGSEFRSYFEITDEITGQTVTTVPYVVGMQYCINNGEKYYISADGAGVSFPVTDNNGNTIKNEEYGYKWYARKKGQSFFEIIGVESSLTLANIEDEMQIYCLLEIPTTVGNEIKTYYHQTNAVIFSTKTGLRNSVFSYKRELLETYLPTGEYDNVWFDLAGEGCEVALGERFFINLSQNELTRRNIPTSASPMWYISANGSNWEFIALPTAYRFYSSYVVGYKFITVIICTDKENPVDFTFLQEVPIDYRYADQAVTAGEHVALLGGHTVGPTLSWYYNPLLLDTVYYVKETSESPWISDVVSNPDALHFWLEFIEGRGELEAFSVRSIGQRSKVVNDKEIKSLYYRTVPEITFSKTSLEGVINIPPSYEGMFIYSAQGKSAKDELDNLIYSHCCNSNSVTFNSIPVYGLEPNKRIRLYNPEAQVEGDYILTKFSVPFAYNSLMSITASKVIERLI